jgi:division protein CdvB (Snf7/Vps24/ESCRT-III family)
MVANVGVVTMGPINFEAVNDDASKILGEAQFVAESKISNGFPPLPGETTGQSVRGEDSKP